MNRYLMPAMGIVAGICIIACDNVRQQEFQFELRDDRHCLVMAVFDHNILDSLQEGAIAPADIYKVYYLNEDSTANIPALPIIGDFVREGEYIYFYPLLGFRNDRLYAIHQRGQLVSKIQFSNLESHPIETRVEAVFPSADSIPQNLLKFYIFFSNPMSEGKSYDMISLISEKGDVVEDSFVELHPELWNENRTRLTIWMDPGRLKRDLGPFLEKGLQFTQNQRYRLEIDRNWLDSHGNPLYVNFQMEYYILPADRIKPDPSKWTISPPTRHTSEPLKIQFYESMDYALALNMITVISMDSTEIDGSIDVGGRETEWHFKPSAAWGEAQYTLRINTFLEDLAGNNLSRLFDVDLSKSQLETPVREFEYLTFRLN